MATNVYFAFMEIEPTVNIHVAGFLLIIKNLSTSPITCLIQNLSLTSGLTECILCHARQLIYIAFCRAQFLILQFIAIPANQRYPLPRFYSRLSFGASPQPRLYPKSAETSSADCTCLQAQPSPATFKYHFDHLGVSVCYKPIIPGYSQQVDIRGSRQVSVPNLVS